MYMSRVLDLSIDRTSLSPLLLARSVPVHAGGIVAGLRYIYKADRIVNEFLK